VAREPGQSSDDEDLVQFYLNDIGKHPLLTQEDEYELGGRIEAGQAAAAKLALAGNLMSPGGRAQLREQVRAGEDAATRFVQANLRLVVSIAKKYQTSGLPLLDLIQEGNFGLIHAVEKFDRSKGFKFSTYATWWIRQAIGRGIANTSRMIRLPVHAGEQLLRLRRASAAFEVGHARPPTPVELSEVTGMPLTKVEELLVFMVDPLSLSEPLSDDGDMELGDLVEDVSAPGTDQAVFDSMLPEAVVQLLAPLDARERDVLCLRYGLDRGEPRTLDEVGALFQLTGERIRNIEAKAMAKLRQATSKGGRDLLSA
jgi:RNA polymerase primary sigma factor